MVLCIPHAVQLLDLRKLATELAAAATSDLILAFNNYELEYNFSYKSKLF